MLHITVHSLHKGPNEPISFVVFSQSFRDKIIKPDKRYGRHS